jgi:quercetin dioxygenase-like cupin family protein
MTRRVYYPSGPGSVPLNPDVPKKDIGQGILLQTIAEGDNINAVHWNLPDGSSVPQHNHVQEQFGYVIKGALEVIIQGYDPFIVNEGDSYIIPSDLPHAFNTIGQTEAIDVFSPPRDLSTAGGAQSE